MSIFSEYLPAEENDGVEELTLIFEGERVRHGIVKHLLNLLKDDVENGHYTDKTSRESLQMMEDFIDDDHSKNDIRVKILK